MPTKKKSKKKSSSSADANANAKAAEAKRTTEALMTDETASPREVRDVLRAFDAQARDEESDSDGGEDETPSTRSPEGQMEQLVKEATELRGKTGSPIVYGMEALPTLACSVPENLKYYGNQGFGDWLYRCPCEHAQRWRAESRRRQRASGVSDDDGDVVEYDLDASEEMSCVSHAMSLAWRGFTTAYMTRAGISLAAHLVRTLRGGTPRRVFNLNHLVGESSLKYREDAVRFGLFTSFFVGGYSATRCWLCYATAAKSLQRGAEKPKISDAPFADTAHVPAIARLVKEPFTPETAASIAGGMAGLSVFFLKKKYRRAFALYLMAKLAQAQFESSKKDHPWLNQGPGSWRHANFALFSLSSAQIMYAYVMRPDTLDRGFWEFIVRAGPIDKETLGLVRNSVLAGTSQNAIVGCDHTHRSTGHLWCTSHAMSSAVSTFKKCFPFYFSIHYVPYVVLNLTKAVKRPINTLYRATKATARSSAMLSTYVGLYMSTVCLHRNSGVRDHRSLYYLAGIVASGALYVENESRRTDLTLWIVPRALDSLVLVLVQKGMLPHIPNFESYLFALVMSGVMSLYEQEPDVLESNLTRFIARFIEPRGRPSLGINRDASVSLM